MERVFAAVLAQQRLHFFVFGHVHRSFAAGILLIHVPTLLDALRNLFEHVVLHRVKEPVPAAVLAQHCSSAFTSSCLARSSGVSHLKETALTAALLASSEATTSFSPPSAALWNGVLPSLSTASTAALLASSEATIFRGVAPTTLGCLVERRLAIQRNGVDDGLAGEQRGHDSLFTPPRCHVERRLALPSL